MRTLLILLALSFSFSANAKLVKTATLTNGGFFNFLTTLTIDCNGSSYEGLELDMLSQSDKIKVYRVTPKYRPLTTMDCAEGSHKVIYKVSKNYQAHPNETLIFLMQDNMELVLSK